MGVSPSWPMEANSGGEGPRRCTTEGARGDDRQTDRHTISALYDDVIHLDHLSA